MDIHKLRAQLGEVNLSELARVAGISLRTVRRFKNNAEYFLNSRTAIKLADAMKKVKAAMRRAV